MKKTNFYCLLAALCLAMNSQGQKKQLHIGDALPFMQFSNVLNNRGHPLSLPAGDGKAIILDFFATWCGGCIKELPRLAALQDSLHGQLQIVLVSREPREKLEPFLQKRAVAKAFPVIYADSLLNELFPNRLIPHDVWIDPKGAVAAITHSEEINFPRLTILANSQPLHLPVKRDMPEYLASQPLDNAAVADVLLWKSVLSSHIDGAGHVQAFMKSDKHCRLLRLNQSLLKLYTSAWLVPANQVELQVENPDPWFADREQPETWSRKWGFTYELTGPVLPVEVFQKRMRRDLDAAFGLCTIYDSANLPVWELFPLANTEIMHVAGQLKGVNEYEDEDARVSFQQQPLKPIANWLNSRNARLLGGLHFDASSLAAPRLYTLQISKAQAEDINMLRPLLASAGIGLRCSMKKMPVLKISDATE